MKLAKVMRNDVLGKVPGGRWDRKCSTASRPCVWGILVYSDVTSTVTRIAPGGRGTGMEARRLRKWLVSFMKDGRLCTMGWKF